MSYKKVLKIVLLFLFIGFTSISCSFLTGDSGESSSTVKYTVEHYKQSVDGKQYELQNDDIEILTGNSSSKTKATPKEYEGFTVKEFKQESIAKNGNTVVKIYYDRNTITLTFDFAGGTDADGNESVTISGLYGTTITPPVPSKKGYFASSWTPALPQTFPKEKATFTTLWEAGEASTITYNLNGGLWKENYSYKNNFNIEDEFELPDSSCLTKTGYEFAGWYESENLAGTIVAKIEKGTIGNKTFYAAWKTGTVNYTVKHYLQNLDATGYEESTSAVQIMTGKTNETTNATANTYEGFAAKDIEQQTIAADGSTIVEIYYNRAYAIQYNLDGGINSEQNLNYYTCENLPLQLSNPVKDGFKFYAWVSEKNEIIKEIPEESRKPISLKALWLEEGESYYLIKHNLQTLSDDSEYDFKEQNYYKGRIGSNTTAIKKAYFGFEYEKSESKTISADGSTIINIYYKRCTIETRFTVKFDDKKNPLEFSLSGKYQEKIIIPNSYYMNDYTAEKYEPYEPTFFGDKENYIISVKSKYEYYQRHDENNGIRIPFVCRDFRGYNETGSGDGFITSEIQSPYNVPTAGHGHPDFESKYSSGDKKGLVGNYLSEEGLPVLARAGYNAYGIQQITSQEAFDMWYRDCPGINITFRDKELILNEKDASNKIYEFTSGNIGGFFPIDNEGYGNSKNYNHNFSFTDDMCFYFTYNGDGKIYISGDDDIWLFINGRLAIDLGGLHSELSDTIELQSQTVEKYIDGEIESFKYNHKFDISEGQQVEVRIFHAERRASGSNFTIRLEGLDIYERRLK